MTGRRIPLLFALGLLFALPTAVRAEDELIVRLDRDEISQDETVELKFQVRGEKGLSVGEPTYTAPQFELLNSYPSHEIQMVSVNGVRSIARVETITHVLHPTAAGTLKITGIKVPVNGKTLTAPDQILQVSPPGAGTPPPRGYGSPGAGLRGNPRRTTEPQVFVQTEISKDKIIKGEQLVVSYYFYARIRVADASPEKYPELPAFLKEELEVPRPMMPERVQRNGVLYDRFLVARYAAYALKEGKLTVDPLVIKYAYIPQMDLDFEDMDPLQSFFGRMTPKQAVARGQPLSVEVLPLPADGKPETFTGGVGEFSVSSAVDKYQVRANEALNLKVKVEGRGNLAAIGEARVQWPADLEVYDSKGTAKVGKAGVGEKLFEYVLIPRAPGKLTLPAMEFAFFDPVQKKYYTRKAEPVEIEVGEPSAGSMAPPRAAASGTPAPMGAQPNPPTVGADFSSVPLRTGGEAFGLSTVLWRGLQTFGVIALGVAALLLAGVTGWIGMSRLRGRAGALRMAHASRSDTRWRKILDPVTRIRPERLAPTEVEAAYESLHRATDEAMVLILGIDPRGSSRQELEQAWREAPAGRLSAEQWEILARFWDYAAAVRFASRAGGVRLEEAQAELPRWRREIEVLLSTLSKLPSAR